MFKEVVNFITPFVMHQDSRLPLMLNAFHDDSALLNRINYEGPAAEFVPRLVQLLRQYGKTTNGMPALWQFLLALKDQGGLDHEREIEAFREWAKSAIPSADIAETKSSSVESAGSSFKEVKRKQLQEELKLKIKQYKAVSDELITNMNPANTPKLQLMIDRLEAEIQTVEQKIAELG